MLKLLRMCLSVAVTAVLVACGAQQDEKLTAPVSGIDQTQLDMSVHPGDDFFAYVNGLWVASTEMPADKSRYGTFDQLRDASRDNVREIIESAAAGNFPVGSDEQKVGDLYRSFLDMETRDALGISPLASEFAAIDAIADTAQLARYFGEASRRGYTVPLGLTQYPDLRNPAIYGLYAFQSGLGLPDREYYLKDDERSLEIKAQYQDHIAKMFALAGLPEGDAAAAEIVALETRLAERQMRKEDLRDWSANYNRVEQEALSEIMPNFDWSVFLAENGIANPGYMIVITTDYLQALDTIILDTPIATWQTYLRWSVLNESASRLTAALDAQNFAFYGTVLSGTPEQEEAWKRAVRLVNGSLGEVVGKVYVSEYFPPEAKARMVTLVDNLIAAYRVSISELDWMGEATKAEALDKLSKFRPKIGYPDVWRDYSGIDIAANDLFGNMARINEFEVQRIINRHGGPVDREEWGMTPQTVNAYYNPPLNEIVFPAAILQPPFFNLAADEAVNYGAIGAVIGHEIGHGFDDSGSQFDGDGVLRNWWTSEDKAQFEARTGQLIAQYDGYRPFDDLQVNGEFTLGENIGDLGGISIGLLAYQMSLNGTEAPVIDDLTGVQRVFLGYAQVWRSKYREEALRRQIATDPHSPAMYRTNGAVRNVPEFYEAFSVTADNNLYLAPEDRVKIW